MIQIKVNGNLYSAIIEGRVSDREWGGRESKSITMKGEYDTVSNIFHDGVSWSIVETYTVQKIGEDDFPVVVDDGQPVFEDRVEEYDNSDFSVLGDITVHPDGTCTVKMGKETNEEKLLILLYGGDA